MVTHSQSPMNAVNEKFDLLIKYGVFNLLGFLVKSERQKIMTCVAFGIASL